MRVPDSDNAVRMRRAGHRVARLDELQRILADTAVVRRVRDDLPLFELFQETEMRNFSRLVYTLFVAQ